MLCLAFRRLALCVNWRSPRGKNRSGSCDSHLPLAAWFDQYHSPLPPVCRVSISLRYPVLTITYNEHSQNRLPLFGPGIFTAKSRSAQSRLAAVKEWLRLTEVLARLLMDST